jgi:hypothetical protein
MPECDERVALANGFERSPVAGMLVFAAQVMALIARPRLRGRARLHLREGVATNAHLLAPLLGAAQSSASWRARRASRAPVRVCGKSKVTPSKSHPRFLIRARLRISASGQMLNNS